MNINNNQSNSPKSAIVINIDIPDGYKIDARASDLKNGKVTFVPIAYSLEEVYRHYDELGENSKGKTKEKARVVSDFLYHNVPSCCFGLYHVMLLKMFFEDVVARDVYNNNLNKGTYVITMANYEPVLVNVDTLQKGSIVFGSKEEAEFVKQMMLDNFDLCCDWSSL